jgi:uncharacterized protein (UPF0332 family)
VNSEELPGWVIAFKKEFIDTGKVAPKFYDYILEACRLEESRQRDPGAISPEEAEAMLRKAAEFVAMAEDFVKREGGGLESS